jgi:hypothetical protein
MLLTDILKFICSKSFLFAALIIAMLITISGCSSLNMLGDKSADKIAPLIDRYCLEVDENIRAELRDKINQKTNGNQVRIDCGADTAP